jgi:hypothetical protein
MSPSRARALLMQYFGPEAGTVFDPDWPETMLQLAPGASREQVVGAVRARLLRMDLHPGAHTPAGRQLAEMLRSVGAQMIMGPGAQWTGELESEVFGESGGPLRAGEVLREPDAGAHGDEALDGGEAWADEPVDPELRELVRHALATIHPRSAALLRARVIASTYGHGHDTLQRVLDDLAGTRPMATALGVQPARADLMGAALPSAVPARAPVAPVRTGDVLKWWAIGFAVSSVAIGLSGVIVWRALRAQAPAPASTTSAPARTPAQVGEVAAPGSAPAPAAQNQARAEAGAPALPNGAVYVSELRAAVAGMEPGDTVALARVREQIVVFLGIWPRLDESARTAVVELVVEAAFKTGAGDAEALIETLSLGRLSPGRTGVVGKDDVWPLAGAAGLLARLSRERELAPELRQGVEQAWTRALGAMRADAGAGSFAWGAQAALRAVALASLDAGWATMGPGEQAAQASGAEGVADRWWSAARRVCSAGPGLTAEHAAQALALDAVTRVLVSGPELLDHQPAFRLTGAMVARLRFNPGDPARARLTAWLGDTRISTGDLHAVTQAVATAASAQGFDASMVLAADASPVDRDSLRAQLIGAWSVSTGEGLTEGGAEQWVTAARSAIADAGGAQEDVEHLAAALLLSRVHQAAVLRARGAPVAPGLLDHTGGLATLIPAMVSAEPRALAPSNAEGDGQFVLKYVVESRGAQAKLARLAEMLGGAIGAADAGLLGELALTSPSELRAAAQQAALRYASEPTMVSAVLDALPRAPRSQRNALFLSQISGGPLVASSDPRWMFLHRRALVERVLYLTAAQGRIGSIDQLSEALADSYGVMAGREGALVPPGQGGFLAVRHAAEFYAMLRAEASRPAAATARPPDLEPLERRLRGRLAVAQGLVQRFAAYQLACAEVLEAIVLRDRPLRDQDVGAVMRAMDEARAKARGTPEQIRAVEEAMVRLRAVQIGEQL